MQGTLLALGLLLVTATAACAQRPWGPRPDSSSTAFVGVTVVPMDSNRLISNQTVIIRNGRIAAIGPANRTTVPSGVKRIDASRMYLMPGLVDMHAHFGPYVAGAEGRLPDLLSLLIANGVTTARSMVGNPTHIALREAIAAGKLLGPHLVLAARQITGPNAPGNFAQLSVKSPEEARQRVQDAKKEGFDFMKLTIAVTPAVHDQVVAAAREAALPVTGHVSPSVGLERALRDRMQIEHLDSYLEATVADSAPVKVSKSQVVPGEILRYIDSAKVRRAAEATRAAGVYVTPTLALFQVGHIRQIPADSILAWPDVAYLTTQNRRALIQARTNYWANTTSTPEERQLFDRFRNHMTKALADAGAGVMAGSDSPNHGLMLGFSLHRELAALAAAGLTPFQVLSAATRVPAEYWGMEAEQGTVAVGRRADLLLLDANPLVSVAAAQRLIGVMLHGRWFPASELSRLLENAKPQAQ